MRTLLKRGTHDLHRDLVLPERTLSVDLDHHNLHLHDGTTPGGLSVGVAVRLSGPTAVLQGNQATYTIVGYDSFATYTVTAGAGTVSITDDTITYTAPASGDIDVLTITRNGVSRTFTITLNTLGLDGIYTELSGGPSARRYHSAVAINGLMYVFGGYGGSNLNDLWVYDPQTDGWTQLTTGATARYIHSAVAIDGRMYVFGGNGGGYLNDLWLVS